MKRELSLFAEKSLREKKEEKTTNHTRIDIKNKTSDSLKNAYFCRKIKMEMEENELKAKDIPRGYPLCFNDGCADKEKCMHYQARLLMPEERDYGQAIFPTAWQDGKCKCFHEKRRVKKAWGFTRLYNNVPSRDKAEARRSVHAFFGRGNGPYYRVHHGENMLSPEEQEKILKIVAQFGSIDGIGFDHYITDWDFDF